MSEKERTCFTCRHWNIEDMEGDLGMCQRYPPTIVVTLADKYFKQMGYLTDSAIQHSTLFPVTIEFHTCGEWTPETP